MTRRKGHLTLLAALGELLDLDWHLNLVGSAAWDPEHAAEIERTVDALGLGERMRMVGEQDDDGLAQFYDSADLFVLASHHEGYGMVLTEALARGLPIVSTTAGAIPETVPAAAGRLVSPGDAEALAGALRQRAHRSATAIDATGGRCSKGRAQTLQSWEESARQFAAVLDEVTATDERLRPRPGWRCASPTTTPCAMPI